jgi:hypothetical protein
MGNLISKKEGNVGNDVFDIGPVTGAPWGIGGNNSFGPAKWIWNTPSARSNADSRVIIKFSKTFKNDSSVLGWYCITVDDIGYIDCNGFPIIKNGDNFYNTTYCSGGWWVQGNGSFIGINKNQYILNGTNRVNIYAINGGGPAGVLGNLMVPGKTVEITSAAWKSKIVNTVQNVIELGDVYSSVKNGAEYASLFKSAKFIWSDKNNEASTTDTNTSPNTYVKYSFVFDYACGNGVSEMGKCNIATNDECYIYMNCESINSEKSFVVSPPINVQGLGKNIDIKYIQGINFVDIIVKNTKTNASLIAAFYKQNNEVAMTLNTINSNTPTPIVTNNQWTYSIIPVQSSEGNIYERPLPVEVKLKNTIMPSCYPDISTKWIWSTRSDAEGTTGVNTLVTFTYEFNYAGNFSKDTSAKDYCYIIVDDMCTLYINDDFSVDVKYGGMIWMNMEQNTYNEFQLKKGLNKIKIVAKNTGGPAGVAAIFYDSNDNIVAYTNKSWKYSLTTNEITTTNTTFNDMNNVEGFTSFKQLKMFEDFSLFNPYKEGFLNFKTWNFAQSSNWYKVIQNGYSIKMSDTGITLPTRQYSIAFLYHLTGLNGTWNNIFHVTNTGRNWGTDTDGGAVCDGCRQPAMWVFPNDINFHLRFSTDPDFNDGINTQDEKIVPIPIGSTKLITITFDNNVVTMYFNDVVVSSKTFVNIHEIKPYAILHIGDPWHGNNGTINIKGFTMYDGVLSAAQVTNIYSNMNKGDPGTPGTPAPPAKDGIPGTAGTPGTPAPPAKDGIPGTPGTPAPPVKDGTPGTPGTPAPIVKDGTPGTPGTPAPPAKNGIPGTPGIDGSKGDPGNTGEPGPKGEKGVPGSTNSKSSLNPGVIMSPNIDRILTNNDTYAYCLGGTIECDDGNTKDTIKLNDYKYGSTYSYKCNSGTQAFCSNGILESQTEQRAYSSPFPFSNSYKGFTVETTEESPYVYDLGTNNITYYINNELIARDDICNYLTIDSARNNCNKTK